MIDGPGVERLCASQLETAIITDLKYVHAVDANDYRFGSIPRTGLNVLQLLSDQEEHTILDIGAGFGTFLEEAKNVRGSSLRAIGFTAVGNNFTNRLDGEIDWVFGDFQRANTWYPRTIEPGTVDLAVAFLAFRHFAHPLSALQNAYRTLKNGGNLIIERASFATDPDTPSVANEIVELLMQRSGEWTGYIGLNGSFVCANNLHLIKGDEDELPLDGIEAIVEPDYDSTVVTYKAA